jgi:hypothetical protein
MIQKLYHQEIETNIIAGSGYDVSHTIKKLSFQSFSIIKPTYAHLSVCKFYKWEI